MIVSFTNRACKKRLVSFFLIISYWLGTSVASWAQGYIYLHKRAFNEESSVNFNFSVSGGPTSVASLTLNDQAATLNPVAGLGGGAGGGLWALAGAIDANGNYGVYYRAPNTGTWVSRVGRLSNIDGGAAGTRIGIAQVNSSGRIFYDNGTTETDVTGNLLASVIDVSDNWQGVQYAVLSNNQVWRRTTSSTVWALIPGISARSVDAVPNSTQIIYKSATTENVIRVNNDGTGSITLGFPANAGGGTEIAVSENGLIVAKFGDYAYRWTTGTTWTQEVTSLLLGLLTGGSASQIWARLPKFLSGINERIYTRTETGLYLTDENVRTSPNDNSALIAVAPGTYTITETAAQGWDLNGITFYESQTPSSANVATNTASVVVSAGEVVHVVFENTLVQTTTISNVCSTSATFIETFGTGTGYGGPLTGLTGYHYANGEYGFGYYSLANTTALMGGYAGNFPDHTGNTNGRMLAVDATSEPGVFYRRRFTGLLPGSVYTFSAWAMNVNTFNAPDVPNISFEVYDPDSGTLISSGNSGNINAVGVWQQTSLAFTATQSIVDLVLRNNTTGTSGNDLAIDDISFGVAIPQPTFQKADATCSTPGSITIASPSGSGYQYSINGTTYQNSPIFTGVAPGSYSVSARYTASTGCVSPPATVTIAQTTGDAPVAPTVSVTSQPSCTLATGTITVSAPVGASLTYSIDGTTYQSSPVFSGVSPGTYAVTVRANSINACTSAATSVTVNPAPVTPVAPTVSVTGQPSCTLATGTITVSSPTGTSLTYSIDGTAYQSSTVFPGVSAGTYAVTVRNTLGCTSAATSVTVTAQPSITATMTSATISTGNSATLTATSSVTGSSYRFSTGLTNTTGILIVSPTTVGANPYSVTVTSSQGCTAVASATVTVLASVPVPTSLTISGQPNPGGTNGVAVPPASFTGTDVSGTVTNIHYTAFPSNVNSLTIGTTVYTAANFPAGGLTVATGTAVRIDPIDGTVTAIIPFRVINNNNVESTITGSVGVPFLVVTDFCNSQILFFNEDFGAGVGFGPPLSTTTVPGYTYRNIDPVNDGLYALVNNPDQADDFATANVWLHGPDHTGNPNGRMLLINGSNPNQIAYTQPISGLVAGRFYSLRTYLANIFNQAVLGTGDIKPNIILRVRDNANNILASISTGDIPAPTTLTWLPYSMSFTASTTSIKFELVSNARAGNGNDYALDDIQFFEVIQPVLTTTSFTSVCPATSATISNVTATNQPVSTTLTWHSGATATAGNRISNITALTSGTYYAAFFDGTCYTQTSPFVVLIVPCANPDAGTTISSANSGTVVSNVATNDFVNGQPATLGTTGNATIAQVGTYPTGVTLNTTTGSISVAVGTAPGSYTVVYQLCDKLSPVNCTTTIATFTVTPSVTASPDAGTVTSGTGGTAVANVVANDVVNGQTATLGVGGNAIIAQVGTYPIGVTMNTTTGSLSVVQGTAPGTYTVVYQLCDKLSTPTCATTTAVITVTPSVTASPDAGTVSSGTGGTAVANVAANDVVNGQPATLGITGNATVASVGTYPTGIILNTTTGSLSVAQGTMPGTYTVVYQLCDRLTPATCATTTALITVTPSVTAFPDAGTVSSGLGGTAVANVVANDVVNGQTATLGAGGNATIAQVGTYPPGVTLNPATGSLSVAQGTTPGTYTVVYQLCDKLTPTTCSTTIVSFTITPGISGTVVNDANGLTDNIISGTGTNAGGLFAILVNANNTVVASVSVSPAGTYRFDNVAPATYSVRLSTTSATIGTTPPAVSLPTGWTSTGEGTAIAGDGLVNGITSVTVGSAEVSGVNFGIDQLPTPTSSTLTAQANPGGINGVSILPASFTGTDPDGSVTNIHYTAFPSNITSLTIGTTVYVLSLGVTVPLGAILFPAGGVTVATGTAVSVDPVDGNVTVVIPFRVLDNANQESTTTGSVSVPFTGLTVSGTVFDDANGLTDNIINGTGTNAGGLFANLVNATGNVVASQALPATGVYSFSNLALGIYNVQLSTTTATVGSPAPAISLPTGWTFTGEGTAPAGDGTPNGSTQIILVAASVTGVNFGIDQLPTPTSSTLTVQANPGGVTGVNIPPASFTGTDPDGTIAAIRFTAFPTNVNSLTVGTTVYTSANFPAGGLTATVGTTLRIDPVDGAVTAAIPFRVIDNANAESTTTGSVSVPFTYVITANPDAGTVSSGTGGTAVANVAANDMINGQSATLGTNGNATVAQVGTYPSGVTLNPATGSLSVAQGATPGSYTVVYQLCDKLSIPTCTTTTVSFTITPGISGTVLHDVKGITDNLVNGTGTNAGGLFAILVNSSNTVIASVSVSPTGTYRFDNVAPGTYGVRISTATGTVGTTPPVASLPASWTFTGEGVAAAGDGTPNGSTSVAVGSAEVSGVNFGIEQLPTPVSTTLAIQPNPGGTNSIEIPQANLMGNDPDGLIPKIRYVSFPTNVTTLFIGNTSYTSATFPAGGVTVGSNVPVRIDPVEGPVTVVITFRVIDDADQESTATGTATIPFACPANPCEVIKIQRIRTQ